MFRFIATCVVLAMLCVVSVVLIGQYLGVNSDPGDVAPANKRLLPGDKPLIVGGVEPPAEGVAGPAVRADREVKVIEVAGGGMSQPLIIQEGRVLPLERQEVPSERDGKLMLLATPVTEEEFVPSDKEVRLDVWVLGVEWKAEDERAGEGQGRKGAIREPFQDRKTGKWYRLPRAEDVLDADRTAMIRLPLRFRKLAENDEVVEGQLLGVINPALAIEEVRTKQSNLRAAASEVPATQSMKEEALRRLISIDKSRAAVRGSVTEDDRGAAKVTYDRYRFEEVAKKAAVDKAQQELSAAWTALDLYFLRAAIPGRIRTIYKQPGEAVRNLDPVMQIQNTRKLRVEAQAEVQDALLLRDRLRKAEQMRLEARNFDKSKPAYAKEMRDQADKLATVQVELTRPVSPKDVLSGHLQEVTCVAVPKGPLPRIVSGSEEGIVRVWERLPGEERWKEKSRLNHFAPIRSLACTGPGAKDNWMVTGTSRGVVRRFDLSNLSEKPLILGTSEDRHQGAIHAIAINAKGTRCATTGDDRSICVWDLGTGTLVARKKGAHNSQITSLAFTPTDRLVSAGRDKRLAIWELKEENLVEVDEIPGRSGEVSTLGLDKTGDLILFDEGRELRVLSLSTRRIEGTLSNGGATGSFSTMALFSPDSRTILTNGNAPGRLQLWRAPSAEHRAAELRQLLWTTGTVTCGAFDPQGNFAVTGTSDHRVLIWDLPKAEETEKPLDALLSYVEENLDAGLRRVTVRATLKDAPEGVIPGTAASIVVPARVGK